jgi:hypothetical protein
MIIKLHPSVASRNGLLAATALLVWHSCGEDTISTNGQMGGLRSRIPSLDKISVAHGNGQTSDVKVVDRADGRGEGSLWIEAEFPPGRRWRVELSSHYAAVGNTVIGVYAENSMLVFNESLPASGLVEPSPNRDANGIYLGWGAIFGFEATGELSAQSRREVEITRLRAGTEGLRIDVKTLFGVTGSLSFDASLRLVDVELRGERMPIFEQPIHFGRGISAGGPLFKEVADKPGGGSVSIWGRSVETGRRYLCTAKTYLDDSEVTWIGPPRAKWVFVGGELWGVASYDDNSVLFRKAVSSEQMDAALNGETINASNIHATEARFFGGYLIPVNKLGSVAGRDVGSIYLHSVQTAGAGLTAIISGSELFAGEVVFDTQNHAATFKAGRGAIGTASWHTIGPATNVTAEPWIGK